MLAVRSAALVAALCLAAAPALAQPTLAGRPAAPAAARATAAALTVPDGFYAETVATGLETPVDAAFTPDGRLVVIEKEGTVVTVENGLRRVALDLRAEVLNSYDRGLLGLALDPAFAATGYVYLLYVVSVDGADTDREDAFSRLTRYTMRPDGTLDPASRRVLLGETFATGIPACFVAHAVGAMAFGRDGSLLLGTGDAASYATADPGGLYPGCFGPGRFPASEDVGAFRAQRAASLSGKILRIDPATGLGLPSNPFFTGDPADNASRVWALGFRNAFRLSLNTATGSADPADGNPGTLYTGDVGWNTYDELNLVRRGQNFGWPCREGPAPQADYAATPRGQAVCPSVLATAPAFYWHSTDPALSNPAGRVARSMLAGPVYAGTAYPAAYRGRAFYADFSFGWMATAAVGPDGALSDDQLFSTETGFIVDIEYDPASESLHLVDVVTGSVWRLAHTPLAGNTPPVAQAGASVAQGGAPLAVQFSGSASFDPDGGPLAFAWTFGDGAASALADPAHTYAATGAYEARLTVTDAAGATASAALAITVRDGSAPTAAIVSPADGAFVLSGQTIRLTAEAADPDQPAESLQVGWNIGLVHDDHTHPDAFLGTGTLLPYTVPFHGDAGDSYALRITLTVTDAQGLTATDERLVPLGEAPDVDITAEGTPIALVTAPTGGGSRSLEVIRDGVRPLPTAAPTDATLQYDTFTGADVRPLDWIGYAFDAPRTLSRLRLTEGIHFANGGWFEALGVQVRQGGQWTDVANLVVTPAYRGNDGRAFDAYDLAFQPVAADGVRIAGAPGGTSRFISVAELRAFAPGAGGFGPLPPDWASLDVGTVGAAGSAGYAGGTFTVRGGGDLWGDFDGLHYARRLLTGDGSITARLTSLAGAHPWAKAGLMIRDGDAGGAPHATVLGTVAQGAHLQYREAPGAETLWQPGPAQTLPMWLRLDRAGDVFSGFVSDDGLAWTAVGAATIPMGPTVSIGLVTTATDYGDRRDLAAATFTDVALTGSLFVTAGAPADAPAFAIASVAPNPTSGRATLRLALDAPGLTRVTVADALGRVVLRRDLRETLAGPLELTLDLAGQGAGVYVVRAESPSGRVATARLSVVR